MSAFICFLAAGLSAAFFAWNLGVAVLCFGVGLAAAFREAQR